MFASLPTSPLPAPSSWKSAMFDHKGWVPISSFYWVIYVIFQHLLLNPGSHAASVPSHPTSYSCKPAIRSGPKWHTVPLIPNLTAPAPHQSHHTGCTTEVGTTELPPPWRSWLCTLWRQGKRHFPILHSSGPTWYTAHIQVAHEWIIERLILIQGHQWTEKVSLRAIEILSQNWKPGNYKFSKKNWVCFPGLFYLCLLNTHTNFLFNMSQQRSQHSAPSFCKLL